jgi:hypothetical protein
MTTTNNKTGEIGEDALNGGGAIDRTVILKAGELV